MRRDSTEYVMLMASLPVASGGYAVDETPISRYQLDERLAMLESRDAAIVSRLESVLQWDQLPMDRTDAEVLSGAAELTAEARNPVISEVVERRLGVRTVMSALRRRKLGEQAPPSSETWGFGELAGHIRRHWNDPTFQLGGSRPWIARAATQLENQESEALERLVMDLIWDDLDRLAEGHYFDFEAVVLYVLRWNVIHRWTVCNRDRAAERFRQMTEDGLGAYAALFAPRSDSAHETSESDAAGETSHDR